MEYTQRIMCEYSSYEKDEDDEDRDITLINFKKLMRTKKCVIFPNQEEIANKVVHAFSQRHIISVLVVAKTQSGKTGSMAATIKKLAESSDIIIPINNIFIVTGLSSCEWREQTMERFPKNMNDNILHRDGLMDTFVERIKYKKNILIIMDEIQIAAKTKQTVYNAFASAGLLDKQYLYTHDIKILEYSATPDGSIYDLDKWSSSSCRILADGGDGYVGANDMLRLGRVFQYKDLWGYNKVTGEIDPAVYDNISEIETLISERYPRPLYHIIRAHVTQGTSENITMENFKQIFDKDHFDFITYDGESGIKDINIILSRRPLKHTFIFIKEMLRCAKTICKKFKGISYERYSTEPHDSTIIQGLVGRDTGYDSNSISICFTNIESIEKYERLWDSGFLDKSIKWQSKTTKFSKRKGLSTGKTKTFNDPTHYGAKSEEKAQEIMPEIKRFSTQSLLKEYYEKNNEEHIGGGKRGPNDRKIKPDGLFYEATLRSTTKVFEESEILANCKWGLNDASKYRVYPCYRNTTDPSTLVWLLIYYKL
jgi:hypothetical protein